MNDIIKKSFDFFPIFEGKQVGIIYHFTDVSKMIQIIEQNALLAGPDEYNIMKTGTLINNPQLAYLDSFSFYFIKKNLNKYANWFINLMRHKNLFSYIALLANNNKTKDELEQMSNKELIDIMLDKFKSTNMLEVIYDYLQREGKLDKIAKEHEKFLRNNIDRVRAISFTRRYNAKIVGRSFVTVRFTFDGNKLSDKYKIMPFDYFSLDTNKQDEFEEIALTKEISNLSKYVIKTEILEREKERVGDLIENMGDTKELKKFNLNYIKDFNQK